VTSVLTARRALGVLAATVLLCSASLVAGSASARADVACPSSWGFDGWGGAVPSQSAALPGWFSGYTRCGMRLSKCTTSGVVTDQGTGATVAKNPSSYELDSSSCFTNVLSSFSLGGSGAAGVPGSVFTPIPGHVYRGDYFVAMTAQPGFSWVSWPPECSLDSYQGTLSCDYHSSYPYPAAVNAPATTGATATAIRAGSS
jgi:hypothetical protein